jgi:hypothetical protein
VAIAPVDKTLRVAGSHPRRWVLDRVVVYRDARDATGDDRVAIIQVLES